MPDNNAPLAFTPKQFGDLIGAGESTIFKRIAEGRLRAVKDGHSVTRILRADAEAYLASLPAITPRRPKP
jgi:excisionase family DNA binding protein